MLRTLFLTLAFFGLVRLVIRLILPRSKASRKARRSTSSAEPTQQTDSLRDLTQQEISDADFEEIPPEE